MSDTGQNFKPYSVSPDGSVEGHQGGYDTIVRNPAPLVYPELPKRSKLVFLSVGSIQDDPLNDRTVVSLSVTASGGGWVANCINGYLIAPGEPLAGSAGPLASQVASPQWGMSRFHIQAPGVPGSVACVQLGADMIPAYGLVLAAYGSGGHLYTLTFDGAGVGRLDQLPAANEIIDFGGAYWWSTHAYTGG